MANELRVYFGFRSPFSRLGLHKIARAGLSEIVPTRLIPFTGPADNAPFFDPMTSPPKLAYYIEDAPRMAGRLGLKTNMPDPFEVSMTRANKAFMAAENAGKGLEFALAVSDARWGQGLNISDMDVLANCAEQAGLERTRPREAKSDPDIAAALEACAADTNADQVFGVPFAVLDQDGRVQKFWGQDRFDLLIETLTS